MRHYIALFLFFYSQVFSLSASRFDVLAIGGAIIDVVAPVTDDYFSQYLAGKGGSHPVDEKTYQELFQALPTDPTFVPGGSAANTAKGMAQLGSKARFFGKRGNDAAGDVFQQNLEQRQVQPCLISDDTPTAQVLCLVTEDGQRTMRILLGASEFLSEEDLTPALFEDVRLAHLEGYQIKNGRLLETAARMAREAGAMVSLDLSSFELIHDYRKEFDSLFQQGIDILFGNEDELLALTGKDPLTSAKEIQNHCPLVVALLGEKGCFVGQNGRVEHYPTVPVATVDSTGAGDLFASGFLHGYLAGYPIEQCAQLGNSLGKTVVQVVGAEIPDEHWDPILTEWRDHLALKDVEIESEVS